MKWGLRVEMKAQTQNAAIHQPPSLWLSFLREVRTYEY